MTDTIYPDAFFDYHEQGSRDSARQAIPVVMEFVQPRSVVDVGCGIGTWLAEFRAAGIEDYLGIDGNYVNRAKLVIAPERFVPRDLEQPLAAERRFDMAVSLEVAEHLPAQAADTFVASLVGLAPLVLFSAAIPFQGGTGHINEQWPEYWQEKFAARGYIAVDCLRDRIWTNKQVKNWYAQNLLFYVARDRLADYPALERVVRFAGESPPLSRVHPDHYLSMYRFLLGAVREAQSAVIRTSLKLREINLLAIPNWRLPPEQILDQLRGVLRGLQMHPQGARVALVVDYGTMPQEPVRQLIGQVHREVLAPGGVALPGPGITAVGGSLGAEQWQALISCCQRRVSLPNEEASAVAARGAQWLPVVNLAGIQGQQMLSP